MVTNVRSLLIAAAACGLLGAGLPAHAASPLPELHGLSASAGASGPVLLLEATGDLDTVHYSPQPGVWVVEMPEATWSETLGMLARPDLGVERATLEHVDEFGKRLSRLTVWLAEPATLQPRVGERGLELRFGAADSPPTVAVKVVPAPPLAAAEPGPQGLDTRRAGNLVDVEPILADGGLVLRLRGDGPLDGQAYLLEGPDRLVLDLPGVVNRVPRQVFPVNAPGIRKVRVAQFRALPDPVARVVVDLESPHGYGYDASPSGGTLTVSGGSPSTATAAVATAAFEPPRVASAATGAPVITNQRTGETTVEPARAPAPAPARNPWVADPGQLIEKATAARTLDFPAAAGERYRSTEVESQEQQFTGEPISLSLKDADIKDVLKTFSTLTGLNIVLDPAVSGSVTVQLNDVPWDQSLDLILRINNLDYVLENNVLRVAPIAKLAAEKRQRLAFEDEQEKSKPLKTVLKPLSYADAGEVRGLLSGDSYLLSPRGSVTVDPRTNTLIIRDTVDRVEGILRLIETLDLPTPQVVIEGRIVESTRNFSRELGISWGFMSVMDAEHGNTTGLQFPSSMSADGQVNLSRGGTNAVLAMSFADILNTFNLDFFLNAAENQGSARVVSSPRVTTQNLKQASIRSGLQIPVQTIANNTVTVQYVDATLNLNVTPQITAEGTVNLKIDIKKQEPRQSQQVAGGQNAPIFTRDAKTELLVRDGGTTVIAGIYQISDESSEDRVPGLHKIPILGYLFKNSGKFMQHDELLIFITPRIVKY